MANKKISQLTNSLTKATVDSADLLPVVDTSASETKKMTYQELIQPTDANFRIAGSADNTKLVAFEVDGLTTATTRTVTIPNATTTMVGTDTTQTLSNKTLTAPQVNMGSDATGDMYYRNGSATTTRLPIGTSGQIIQTSASGIPEWIANPAAADASTTVKGVSEESTQAESDAGTAAGGTAARLFVNPSTLRARLLNTGIADTGSANTVAIAPSPAITAYATYQEFTFKANATNTSATTINVNALGAKNIFNKGAACRGGEIVSGQVYTVVYDGTQFQLTSQPTADIDGMVYEGSLSWSASSADQTLTFTNSGRRLYIIHFGFDIVGQVNLRFNADSSALYYYTTLSTTTLTSAATQTSMAFIGASSLSAAGTLNVVGLSTGAGSRAIGVSGNVATRHDVPNLERGYWSPSGTTSVTSVTFLVNATATTGSIRAYSIPL